MSYDKEFVFLDVLTWVGTDIVAEHYYGYLSRGSAEECVDVCHTLSAEEARALNKKNRDSGEMLGLPALGVYEEGGESKQFTSLEELIQAAKPLWREAYPGALFMILGRSYVAEPQRILDGDMDDPRVIRLNEMAERRKSLDWDRKQDVPELERNQKEFCKIMETFGENNDHKN